MISSVPGVFAHEYQSDSRAGADCATYSLLDNNQCGRAELAGKSVAVPIVGAAAATLVVAEAIKFLHGGPA